jgi:Transmembrane secretion effector
MALFNITIQLSAPRWVSGRALAGFWSAVAAGLALGSDTKSRLFHVGYFCVI